MYKVSDLQQGSLNYVLEDYLSKCSLFVILALEQTFGMLYVVAAFWLSLSSVTDWKQYLQCLQL